MIKITNAYEATDSAGRFMVGVLNGTLDSLIPPYLVELKEVSKTKTDHNASNQILFSSINTIFPGGNFNRFRLFLTDGASYMIKFGKNQKELFLKCYISHVQLMGYHV